MQAAHLGSADPIAEQKYFALMQRRECVAEWDGTVIESLLLDASLLGTLLVHPLSKIDRTEQYKRKSMRMCPQHIGQNNRGKRPTQKLFLDIKRGMHYEQRQS